MKRSTWIACLMLLATGLACSIGRTPVPTTPWPDWLATNAVQTVESYLTQSASMEPPIFPTVSLPTLPPFTTATPPPATSTSPPATATAPCNQARFISDVTVPDGTTFAPNVTFTKTWRLQNTGSCAWSGYSLVFHSGDAMSGPTSQPLGTISPGAMVDISVNLVAPAAAGNYRGYWRIRTGSGSFVPIVNATDGQSFFVDIRVQAAATATFTHTFAIVPVVSVLKFDFYAKAPEAQWISGDGAGNSTVLTFGGPDSDANGFVMYRDGFLLEDGSRPEKVLQTHPKWVDNGVISGRYPPYTVQSQDRFVVKVGFLARADGSCGVGNVIYQLAYREGGALHPISSWTETCNGHLVAASIDLSSLAGRTVEFVLVVLANGSSAQDWAVWIAPRIVNP